MCRIPVCVSLTSPLFCCSTYLLAVIVGEFDYIGQTTADGAVMVRVYTGRGRSAQGEFGLHVACKALSYFGEFFGSPFPLPKVDLLAIPDFAAGAM